MMLSDLELFPNKVNWVSLVRHLLMSLGFYQVWLNQGVGNIIIFQFLSKGLLIFSYKTGRKD